MKESLTTENGITPAGEQYLEIGDSEGGFLFIGEGVELGRMIAADMKEEAKRRAHGTAR